MNELDFDDEIDLDDEMDLDDEIVFGEVRYDEEKTVP